MTTAHDPNVLPAELPVPQDDGAALHLAGLEIPSVPLAATDGSTVDLSNLTGRTVVFIYPRDRTKDFIKRVVAVAGDVVEIRHKQVYINGAKVDDPHATFVDDGREIPGPRDNFGPVTIPPHHLFAMGDNRDRSHDGRFWGFVDLDDVKGRAFLVYWSQEWNRIGASLKE